MSWKASSQRFFTSSVASIVDQTVLSALNFGIGLLLIRYTTKENYGLYAQLFAAGLIATTLLEAIVGGPMTTVASGQPETTRRRMIGQLLHVQVYGAAGMALLFLSGCAALLLDTQVLPQLRDVVTITLAFGFYVFTSACREYVRTALFIEGRVLQVLTLDLKFVVITLGALAVLMLLGPLHIAELLACMGLACIVAAWPHLRAWWPPQSPSWAMLVQAMRPLAAQTKWALPGAAVGLTGNYSYLYLTSALLGLAATADLNASRLLLVPVAMMGVAWSRVARPVVSRMHSQHDWSGLTRLAIKSISAIELVTVVYVGALLLSFSWLAHAVLSAKYADVGPLVMAWGVYFTVNAVRWVGTTWLTSFGGYRTLFWQGSLSLVVLFVAAFLLIPRYGTLGAVYALTVVELWETAVNWLYLVPRAQARAAAAAATLAGPSA